METIQEPAPVAARQPVKLELLTHLKHNGSLFRAGTIVDADDLGPVTTAQLLEAGSARPLLPGGAVGAEQQSAMDVELQVAREARHELERQLEALQAELKGELVP